MPRKRDLTDEEKRVLKDAMKDVAPLIRRRIMEVELSAPPGKPKRIARRYAPEPEKPTPEARKSGKVDKPTVERVKRGEYAIDGKLDLHGMTLEEAFRKLTSFVEKHHAKGSRQLLIITGKGGKDGKKGLLQAEVPRWLAHSALSGKILVVSSAQPKHGGEGALYVLLRRKKS